MKTQQQVRAWRAIEALRAGVPNRDAVRALGSFQPEAEERFRQMLAAVRDGGASGATEGLIVAGEFGAGKSHLLEHLRHVALEQNFVCGRVVISKETPLSDPAKVYNAAIEATVVPERAGSGLADVVARLDFKSDAYREFLVWVNSPGSGVSRRFAATAYVFEHAGEEARDRIRQFWSGAPLGIGELKTWLRALGQAGAYKLDKVTVKDLALQRYIFTPRLIAAAGFSGWVLLVDEVELIGRYSLRQRARSYAEVARLMGKLRGAGMPWLASVLSITQDFESAVLDDRKDAEKVPAKLRDSDALLATQAERGMRVIRRDKVRLQEPTDDTLREVFRKARELYAEAYAWHPPDGPPEADRTWTIRQHVKRWINEWDLRRLYPDYQPDIRVAELRQEYFEAPDLEAPSEDRAPGPEGG